MNLRSTLLTALFLPLFAQAQSSPGIPDGPIPALVARPLLEQDPSVAAARATLDAARRESNILDASPYEWTARATGQRRRVENEANSNEWNVALERTIRLPAKASADRKLGQATVDEAEARYGEAMHEAARDLLELWMAWLQANANYELSKSMQQFAVENLSAVQKRAKAGDAAKLDVSLAQSELAEQRRQTNEAKLGASLTWTQLHSRFPGFDGQFSNFPNISALAQDSGYLQARIREQSDRFKAAEAAWRSADAQAQRSRAERTPDPTLGVFSGSEARGRERLVGVSISIPIPSGSRSERAIQATHVAEAKRQELEAIRRQIGAEIDSSIITVQSNYDGMLLAEESANSMRENARLMQRAYLLGEGDLQGLLLTQRQAATAQQGALGAKTSAIRSYYQLLIDSHLIWGLEQN
ncbi:TolC family protein [Herbaspirillum huttiense]|jgi:cobalt-zinc-cadmium efflux system outer membrane protein|uniref:TolC family protein n=1 Tax=Herbaspirillum TaxID=963 RepID=UPI00067CCE5F|nr:MULTISPECIES: TolC family protein [Herbaspirillum]MCP3656833.1 TolC family protein [Herbaspirillum sp.]MCP3950563.1 TolC family protein [Herbaspirillum sp.]MCP4031098.1 TolC family protein [Herbaspirillum sp.]MRT30949.1 TolC family protein [Herbaspirillum sp. CAH-3]ONN67828.1 hypothetical protein BTM36_04290 [Herbaspirillum sp. VT-16-41]